AVPARHPGRLPRHDPGAGEPGAAALRPRIAVRADRGRRALPDGAAPHRHQQADRGLPGHITLQPRLAGPTQRAQVFSQATRWLVRVMTGKVQRPPPDYRRIVIRLRYGIKGRSDRRATSTGQRAWLTYTRIGLYHLPSGE